MIVYDLKCRKDHVFEAWFPDSASFAEQAAGGKVLCPVCGSRKVAKALMAPNVVAKKGRTAGPVKADAKAPGGGMAPGAAAVTADQDSEKAGQLRRLLRDLRDHVEKNCDYVGPAFAEEARKIHYGETDARGIYGETSADEAEALAEEGIEVARVPWLPRENS
ncbi:MAG: DUF1178 family protein [Kiloniellaceae bacterium]